MLSVLRRTSSGSCHSVYAKSVYIGRLETTGKARLELLYLMWPFCRSLECEKWEWVQGQSWETNRNSIWLLWFLFFFLQMCILKSHLFKHGLWFSFQYWMPLIEHMVFYLWAEDCSLTACKNEQDECKQSILCIFVNKQIVYIGENIAQKNIDEIDDIFSQSFLISCLFLKCLVI